MVRALVLLLVLANLLFFVWAAGYLGTGNEGREPERLTAQLQPDRVRIAVRDDKGPSPAEKSKASPDAAPPSVDPGAGAPPATPAVMPVGSSAEIICRRIGPMSRADGEKLAGALGEKGGKVSPLVAADGNNYWVHIPGGDGVPVEKRVAELKQAGITDFFVASEGTNKGAISLGLFHREAVAKELVQRLARKGIQSARIDIKPRKGDRVMLDVHAPAEFMDRELGGQSFPVVACPKE